VHWSPLATRHWLRFVGLTKKQTWGSVIWCTCRSASLNDTWRNPT